jgi:hypothetical protein
MSNEPEAWAGGEIMLECLDIRRRSFGQHFDAAVIKVLHITNNLMSRRRALREETIADALHVAADKESTSYHTGKYSHDSRTPRPFALNGI